MTVNLLDLDAARLTAFLADNGEKPFRARQVLRWLHRFGQRDFDAMTDIAKSLREKLKALAVVVPPGLLADRVSDDGTRKFLFDVGGGNVIESVFIPELDRGTLCISTQAGCALDCSFCSTGKQGFNRNLTVAEIIGQLWQAARRNFYSKLFNDRCLSRPGESDQEGIVLVHPVERCAKPQDLRLAPYRTAKFSFACQSREVTAKSCKARRGPASIDGRDRFGNQWDTRRDCAVLCQFDELASRNANSSEITSNRGIA